MDQTSIILTVALGIALGVAGLLGWACYRLVVDRGHLLLRLGKAGSEGTILSAGLPAGTMVPDFALPSLSGDTVTLSALTGRSLLLVLVRPDCLYSRTLARELADLAPSPEAPLSVLIISGEAGDPRALSSFSGLPGLTLLDPDAQLARMIRVPVTPAGYLVDRQRCTCGRLLAGPTALLAAAQGKPSLAAQGPPLAVSPLPKHALTLPALPIGAGAPDFTLPTVAGDHRSRRELLGQPFTLIFSDPECPPCASLLARLGRERNHGIVLVSRGDAGLNRRAAAQAGVTAPVLLQQNREMARAYGLLDTPAAYAIDAEGRIAAGPAIGTEAVIELVVRGNSRVGERYKSTREGIAPASEPSVV